MIQNLDTKDQRTEDSDVQECWDTLIPAHRHENRERKMAKERRG